MSEPALFEGETVVLRSQGSCQDGHSYSPWQLGHSYLTNKRLFFVQGTRPSFAVDLDAIRKLKIVKRGWLLGVRIEQLCVSYKTGRDERTVYLALKKPEGWVVTIRENLTLMLAEKQWGNDAGNPGSRGHTQRSAG